MDINNVDELKSEVSRLYRALDESESEIKKLNLQNQNLKSVSGVPSFSSKIVIKKKVEKCLFFEKVAIFKKLSNIWNFRKKLKFSKTKFSDFPKNHKIFK